MVEALDMTGARRLVEDLAAIGAASVARLGDTLAAALSALRSRIGSRRG